MYKVMIADDERLIRITLKNIIDWEALDCEIIAMVKDGKEAYHVFQEAHPEIVITDLKMPEMDGIELITKIKEASKNTQVIALSNYSDFELVRDAMKAGAFDYLLKIGLDKNDLIRIIEQVKEIAEVHSNSESDESLAALLQLQQCMVLTKKERLLSQDEFMKVLAHPYFSTYQEHYQLAYFRVDNIYTIYEQRFHDHQVLRKHLQDLIRESIPITTEHMVVFISNHSGVIIFNSNERLRITNICNSILRNLMQYIDTQLTIVLSDVNTSFEAYYDTYMGLIQTHDTRFYQWEGSLIQIETTTEFQNLDMNDITFHLAIIEAMLARDFKRVDDLILESLRYMSDMMIEPYMALEYYIFIFNNIEGNEISKGTRHALQFDKIGARIRKCETIAKLKEVLEESFDEIQSWMLDENQVKYRKEILDIMTFIDEQYQRKLTLRIIADEFHMNENSLSRLFKNETGTNLNYYINEKKMKKAMELLSDPNYRIKDIASYVGMEDQLYFNKVFRKYYDVSPSDYRKKINPDSEE